MSAFLLVLTACSSRSPIPMASAEKVLAATPAPSEPILKNGDVIDVGFVGSSDLIKTPYRIAAGDILRVDVMDHPSLSKERVVVLQDGYISVPLIGRIKAAQMGVDQLGEILRNAYKSEDIVKPKVVVSVEQSQDPITPLLQLVSRNGQYVPLRFIIGHSDTIDLPFIEPVNVQTTLSDLRRSIKQKYHEQYGERLYVMVRLLERAPPVVYVIGEVTRPGPVPYTMPYSPLMAVASAGGLIPTAESSDVRLFRRQADNTYLNWSIDLAARLDKGESASDQFELLPSDIIYVPKTGIAEANQFVEQYIRKMIPLQFGVGFSYSINDGSNN
ncbi:polysaccharide biosynthesis/export family protein [Aliiglaciecola litoralis]